MKRTFTTTRDDVQVYLKPRAEVTVFPAIHEEGLKAFYESHGIQSKVENSFAAEHIAEFSGRLCYMSYDSRRPGGSATYLENILFSGHGSVLEHANIGVVCWGVSRSLTHELVRHRAGMAYSQLSQRYVDDRDLAFVLPPELRGDYEKNSQLFTDWLDARGEDAERYRVLADQLEDRMVLADGPGVTLSSDLKRERRKRVRQTARNELPNCTETKIQVTANVRAWRHFFEMRASMHADTEIRALAVLLFDKVSQVGPLLFADFEKKLDAETGTRYLTNKYRKV